MMIFVFFSAVFADNKEQEKRFKAAGYLPWDKY